MSDTTTTRLEKTPAGYNVFDGTALIGHVEKKTESSYAYAGNTRIAVGRIESTRWAFRLVGTRDWFKGYATRRDAIDALTRRASR